MNKNEYKLGTKINSAKLYNGTNMDGVIFQINYNIHQSILDILQVKWDNGQVAKFDRYTLNRWL